jgi:hypothetical protein
VSREVALWAGIVALLLIGGLLLGQSAWTPSEGAEGMSLRQWMWESRSLDLAVQVGLIFVGALGIAALLPRGREDDD